MSGIVKLNQSCFVVIVLITSTPEGLFKICHHDGNENVKKAMARLSKQQLYDVQQHALIFVHFFTVIPRLGREIA